MMITPYEAHNQMGWFILKQILSTILSIIDSTRLSNQKKDLEILILRQQLSILQRKHAFPSNLNRFETMTYDRIQGELVKLSFKVAQSTVRNILDQHEIQAVPVHNRFENHRQTNGLGEFPK